MQCEAPPLFIVGADGNNHLVNYRKHGNYYIVDRLFAAAELRLGGKQQQAVRITRTDGRQPPKLDPGQMQLRASPRRAVRFRRSMIIAIAAIGSGAILGITMMALQGPALRLKGGRALQYRMQASTGNRNMGNLRTLYADYYRHLGFPEQKNPFADLSFSDKSKRSRPPFPTAGSALTP